MEYDTKSVDLAIKLAPKKVFLIHTIETIAYTYEAIGSENDTEETIRQRFEDNDLTLSFNEYDSEVLRVEVDEVQCSLNKAKQSVGVNLVETVK